MKPKRVIVWGAGTLGVDGLRIIIENPALELVGLHASSEKKQGMDAGDIAGTKKTNVFATSNVDALLALKADCVVYFGSSALRDKAITDDVIPFLESGTNVVSISHFDLQFPAYGRPEFVEPIKKACEVGNSSILITGEDPGFAFGQNLFCLLSVSGRLDSIRITEMDNVRGYGGLDSLKMYGFNEPLDYVPPMFTSEVGQAWHINTLRAIADFLDIEIDDFTQTWETASVDFDYEAAAFGMAGAGKTAATRWTVNAMIDGKPFITYEKILRLHEDAAPDWPAAMLGEKSAPVTHRYEISGDPNYRVELHQPGGSSLTAIIAVNAVPYVCGAASGIVLQKDLPNCPPRNIPAKRSRGRY